MASSARGLRLLKTLEIIKSQQSFDAIAVISKVKLQSANNGVLKGTFDVDPTICNLTKNLHGGYIASIIDVFSCFSQLSNPDGRVSLTTSMNVVYIANAKIGETVNVETKSLLSGNSSIVETYLTNASGKLLAKGVSAYLAGGEKYQQLGKMFNFDVYEQ